MSVCSHHAYWMKGAEMESLIMDDICPAICRETGDCLLGNDTSKYIDSCADAVALKAKLENPETMVLVAVPKVVDSLVGWKNQSYGPIQFDSVKGTMEYNPEGIAGTTMVWFWVRPASTLDLEVEEKPLPTFADVKGIFNDEEKGATDEV